MKVTPEMGKAKAESGLSTESEGAVQMMGQSFAPPAFQVSANPPAQMKKAEESEEQEQEATQLMAAPGGPVDSGACGCESCVQAKMAPGTEAVQMKVIQRAGPDYLVSQSFLGHSPQVNPVLAARLRLVEAELQRQYDALPAEGKPASLRAYSGLSSIRGWRSSTSKHGSGSAVDCNYDNQPYIPTRTGNTYGGEEGGASDETRALRRPAVEVYDRAMNFMRLAESDPTTADVSNRGTNETTTSAYRRFRATSDNLATYIGLAFHTNYNTVSRRPAIDIEGMSDDQLLAAIPTTERKDEDTGIAEIQACMDDPAWQAMHPNWPMTARQQYFRILRDYEIVRKPMQRGNPSTRPTNTRNPALGFLHMPEHFVVAMHDVGNLRWGACDFGAGSNGDVHHFDLGSHGGYQPE